MKRLICGVMLASALFAPALHAAIELSPEAKSAQGELESIELEAKRQWVRSITAAESGRGASPLIARDLQRRIQELQSATKGPVRASIVGFDRRVERAALDSAAPSEPIIVGSAEISGIVTDPVTTLPLAGAYVSARTANGDSFGATTATDGRYSIRVKSGTYRVVATAKHRVAAALDSVVAKWTAPATGVNFAPPLGATISGALHPAADPSQSVYAEVSIYDSTGALATVVGGAQYETWEGLAPGTYYAVAGNNGFRRRLYNGIDCSSGCDVTTGAPIVISGTTNITGIDFTLDSAGSIGGVVTDEATGRPIDALVSIYRGDNTLQSMVYSYNGHFTSALLPNATYYLVCEMPPPPRFTPSTRVEAGFARSTNVAQQSAAVTVTSSDYDLGFTAELYDNHPWPCAGCTPSSGTPIVVNDNSTHNLAIALSNPLARISGRLSSVGGVDDTVTLTAVDAATGLELGSTTAYNGQDYVLVLHRPASSVFVSATSYSWVTQWFDHLNCSTACSPTAVQVSPGTIITGIDFLLTPRSSVSGTVTDDAGNPLQSVRIDTLSNSGQRLSAYTNASGQYRLSTDDSSLQLSAASYFWSGNSASELYDNIPCMTYPCDLSIGTVVSLGPREQVSGINFSLAAGAEIFGDLKDAVSGNPIYKTATVTLVPAGSSVPWRSWEAYGSFNARGLSAGDYYLRVAIPGYRTTFYGGATCTTSCEPPLGTPIHLNAGTLFNATLALQPSGGQITGRITDRRTGAPLIGAGVNAYKTDGTFLRSASAGADGRYVLDADPAVTQFKLVASPYNRPAMQQLYPALECGNSCDIVNQGTIVTTSPGILTTADFALRLQEVVSIDPPVGSTSGGESVHVHGHDFVASSTVTFGDVPVTIVSFSETDITVRTPAHAAGAVDVKVTSPEGIEALLRAAFNFSAQPLARPYLVKDINLRGNAQYTSPTRLVAQGTSITYLLNPELEVVDDSTGSTLPIDFGGGSYPPASQNCSLGDVLVYVSSGHLWSVGTGRRPLDLGQVADQTSFGAIIERAGDRLLVVVPQNLYFANIYKTDGTAAGTVELLRTIRDLRSISKTLVSGANTFFTTSSPEGTTLWRTDMSVAGTASLLTVAETQSYIPSTPVELNGTIYFLVRNSFGESALISYDPATLQSQTVSAFSTGASALSLVGSTLVFLASDQNGGSGVWISDGSAGGTSLLRSGDAAELTSIGPAAIFRSGTAWFAINAALAVQPLPIDAADPTVYNVLGVSNGRVFVGTHSAEQSKIWSTAGDAASTASLSVEVRAAEEVLPRFIASETLAAFANGTKLLASDGSMGGTHNIGAIATVDSSVPFRFASMDGLLYFAGTDQSGVRRLWRSDGTAAGTSTVSTVPSVPRQLSRLGSMIIFTALDAPRHRSLWRSDGTAAGTVRIGLGFEFTDDDPPASVATSRAVFLNRALDGGAAVVATDGTEAGTFGLPVNVTERIACGDRLYFAGTQFNSQARDLWVTDGTQAATTHLFSLNGRPLLGCAAGRLYFTQGDYTAQQLWTTDGTAAGTSQLTGTLNITALTGAQTTLYYSVKTATGGELWATDGTATTTRKLSDVLATKGTEVRGQFLFFAPNAGQSFLWRSDGTPSGTLPIRAVPAARARYEASGRLIFTIGNAWSEGEMWTSDGTTNGTYPISTINPTVPSYEVDYYEGSQEALAAMQVGSRFFFAGTDRDHATELWAMNLDNVPSLSAVSPSSGPAGGGSQLAISGTNLAPGMHFSLSGVELRNAVTSSALSVSGSTPPLAPGRLYDLELEDGDTVRIPNAFFADFVDVPQGYLFHSYVEKLFRHDVTRGCAAGTYCPEQTLRRDQMAAFIARSMAGSDASVPAQGSVNGVAYQCTAAGVSLFSDVSPSDPFCRHIHYIANRGVTLGCASGSFCPSGLVQRAEMAIFLARAIGGGEAAVPSVYRDATTGRSYDLTPSEPNRHFTDIAPGAIYDRHAHYLWARGVSDGCAPTAYCPNDNVTRGQMAKFLAQAFALQ